MPVPIVGEMNTNHRHHLIVQFAPLVVVFREGVVMPAGQGTHVHNDSDEAVPLVLLFVTARVSKPLLRVRPQIDSLWKLHLVVQLLLRSADISSGTELKENQF